MSGKSYGLAVDAEYHPRWIKHGGNFREENFRKPDVDYSLALYWSAGASGMTRAAAGVIV